MYKHVYRYFYYPEDDSDILVTGHNGIRDFRMLGDTSVTDRVDVLIASTTDVTLEQIQVEYVRLFDYRPKCPPYEAIYLKDLGRNSVINDLLSLYRGAGLKYSTTIVPDHISVELEFMHYLTYVEAENLKGNSKELKTFLEYEKNFLNNHLKNWLPGFCDKLTETTRLPFFQSLAQLAKDFVLHDTDYVSSLLSRPFEFTFSL